MRVLPGVLAAFVCLGCGGGGGGGGGAEAPSDSPRQGSMDDVPPPRTEAVLVGPLCKGEACQCRQGDDDAGAPAAGYKRFEIKLGPSDDPLWALVDGMVLHKSGESADACFYVDMKPGLHAISLRARGEEGLSAAMSVSEQGGSDDQTWWYRTFDFQCGAPGQCDLKTLAAWKEEVSTLEGKHDPCGSVKVQGIRWETGRMPDNVHPGDLLLHATLNVYKFAPENPPGSDRCDRRGGPAE